MEDIEKIGGGIQDAEAHYAAWSAEKRKRYEELIMNRHDYDVVLQHSYDMGIQAGVEQGREEGKEEGRAEVKADTAKRMKEIGIDTETIIQVTGLDYATISNL